jgi:hypothetical protein
VTNFLNMFVTLVPNRAIVDKLNKVNNKKIKRQDFAIKFEVWVQILFCSFLKLSMLLHTIHR